MAHTRAKLMCLLCDAAVHAPLTLGPLPVPAAPLYPASRRVLGYYGGEESEDAFDMRRACARNAGRKVDAMRPLSRPIRPHEMWPTDGSVPLQ